MICRRASNLLVAFLCLAPGAVRAGADALSGEVQGIFQRASGAVVKIQAEDDNGRLFGTGFFIDPNGTIFTNYSVGGESHDIVVSDGVTRYPATRVAADARSGLAILKIEAQKTPFLPLGSSSGVAIGSIVIAMGYPMDLPLTPNVGCVGGFGVDAGNRVFAVSHLRANVPVQRGEGGAPLMNMDGEVIGILESSLDGGAGCFVLPIEAAEKVRKDVLRFGEARPGWLGIRFQTSGNPGADSIQVIGFIPGSPGEKSGLQPGDLISAVGGRKVGSMADVLDASFYLTAGDEVPLKVLRGGQPVEIKVQTTLNPNVAVGTGASPSPAPVEVFNLSFQVGK